MVSSPIEFHCADIHFALKQKTILRTWITAVCKQHQFKLRAISFVFCSDEYLLRINQQYLSHDYYTDIITFDNSSQGQIELEAYISIDRVKENAKSLGIPYYEELHRVLIHGVLHALGYKDKNPKQAAEMRSAEDTSLIRLQKLTAH
jgi:probable rRNA maturation factor